MIGISLSVGIGVSEDSVPVGVGDALLTEASEELTTEDGAYLQMENSDD